MTSPPSPPTEAGAPFPSRQSSTSSITISRASSKRTLASVPSSEVLAAHPLLSTSPALEPANGAGSYPVYSRHAKRLSQASAESVPLPALSPPTPPPASPSPAPTSSQPTSPLPPLISRPSSSSFPAANRPPARSVSEATRSLLKAKVEGDVQQLGLAMESGGAAMVLKLSALGKEPEWSGVLAALASGKVTLCLPAEKLPAQAFLTPAFFLDHLAVIEPAPVASTSTAPSSTQAFATLSGFRGTISSESIGITSCGTAIFESPQGLFKPGSLAAPPFADYNFHLGVLGAAIPTPPPAPSTFPSFTIVTPLSELSIPRQAPRSVPPVPSERRMESIGRAAGATGSRLAALFAKSAPSPPASFDDLPPIVPLPPGLLPSTLSPSPELTSELPPTPPRPSIPNLELSVLGIDKIIRHADVARSVGRSLDLALRDALHSVDGLEESALIPDAVCAFAARFQPPLGWTTSLFTPGKFPPAPDSLFTKDAVDVSDQFQNLVHGTREELARVLGEDDRIDAALERVEEVVTGALYDRLFSPHSSGDQQADENLASRIAALNILELSLDHLGIDLAGGGLDEWNDGQRTIRDSLEDIIGLAGKELGRLQEVSVRSPAAKLAVFVNIHKIIVEGLGRLPTIPLKESTDSTPFTVRKAVDEVELEMDDAASRSRSQSQSQSRADSPTSTESADLPTINLPAADLEISMHEASLGSVFDVTPRASPPPTPSSSSSADLILPLLIYLVVQWNPPRLPSTLAYIQRFRSDQLLRGEASYCVTNLHAVCEFLSSVDISALGLSSQKIGGGFAADALLLQPTATATPAGGKLKGRVSNVTQELDQFVDTANSAIAGVVDSSFRMLFGARGLAPKTIEDVKNALDGANSVASKARGSLLRRATSPASLQLPGTEAPEGLQREMVDITAPPQPATDDEDDDARSVRSVRSVSSFLRTRDTSGASDERPSIGERLASIASLQRFGGDSKSASPAAASPAPSPAKPFVPSSIPARRPTIVSRSPSGTVAPIQRFLDCEADDIRVGDVSILLSEYRKLAAELARLGALLEGHDAEAEVEGGS